MKFFISITLLFVSVSLLAQPFGNNAFQYVNNSKDELNPVMSPDGKTLFVTLANHPENIGGIKDPGDIWFSGLTESNQWSALTHGGVLLNSRDYNAVAGLSSDGTELYLLSHYSDAGSVRTQGIAVSRRNGNGWSKPENISIPYFQNKSGLLCGYVQPNKSVFVFSAETYGTRGVDDLYVTLRGSDGKWMEPRNLGSKINTQFQELCPSLSGDGMTLYFSSNGRKGSGSFDVYYSTRLDDTWANWSEPVNMGANINSDGRDLFYRAYADFGFSIFTSTKNSDGYGDVKIYISNVPLPKDSASTIVNAVDTLKTFIEIKHEPEDDKKINVYGKVSNAKTGEFIHAVVMFSAPSMNQSINATGSAGFTVRIPSTDSYEIKIVAQGYVSALEKLDVNTFELRELEMNFKLQPIEVGTTVNLKNVLFEQSKTLLLSQSYPELDLVASFLIANPKVKIELAGHTDNRGIPAQNTKLSQARVDKVKDYLVQKGIDKKRITGKGYGGSKPIASNDTEETRQLNRRVEFVIKKF